jgi:hypothetical protein
VGPPTNSDLDQVFKLVENHWNRFFEGDVGKFGFLKVKIDSSAKTFSKKDWTSEKGWTDWQLMNEKDFQSRHKMLPLVLGDLRTQLLTRQ